MINSIFLRDCKDMQEIPLKRWRENWWQMLVINFWYSSTVETYYDRFLKLWSPMQSKINLLWSPLRLDQGPLKDLDGSLHLHNLILWNIPVLYPYGLEARENLQKLYVKIYLLSQRGPNIFEFTKGQIILKCIFGFFNFFQ